MSATCVAATICVELFDSISNFLQLIIACVPLSKEGVGVAIIICSKLYCKIEMSFFFFIYIKSCKILTINAHSVFLVKLFVEIFISQLLLDICEVYLYRPCLYVPCRVDLFNRHENIDRHFLTEIFNIGLVRIVIVQL